MSKSLTKEQWRSRVVGFVEKPANQFTANALNFRRHPNNQRDAFRGLVSEIGFAGAVLENVKTGNLIDGHLRIEEALSVDENQLIPCVQVDLSESEEKLLLASYDPISAMATADKETLDSLLREVSTRDAAVRQMLSDLAENNGLYFGENGSNRVSPAPEAQLDRAAELQEKWRVKRGDLWRIGRHRLLCGDSTIPQDVFRLMGDRRAALLFTSPPYAEMRQYGGDKELSVEHLAAFIPAWTSSADFLAVNLGLQFRDCEVVEYWRPYIQSARDCGLKLLAWNVWDKTQAGGIAHATNMFFLSHEWIFVFGAERKKLNRTVPNQLDKYEQRHGKNWRAGINKSLRGQDDAMFETTSKTYSHHQLHSVVQQVPELGNIRGLHPAIFPIGLPAEYIRAFVGDGQIVADAFGGSGQTMIAAEKEDRAAYLNELEPKYCAVILERMSLLGLTPKLINDRGDI